MARFMDRNSASNTVVELIADCGPVAATDIAAWLAIPPSDVHAYVHTLAHEGYVERDEFGRLATWCAWPRIGL